MKTFFMPFFNIYVLLLMLILLSFNRFTDLDALGMNTLVLGKALQWS